MIFASPLKCFTVSDKASKSPRAKFIFKLKSAMESSNRVRTEIKEEEKRNRQFEDDDDFDDDEDFFESEDWGSAYSSQNSIEERSKREKIQSAFQMGLSSADSKLDDMDAKQALAPSPKGENKYQFVGVVQSGEKGNKRTNVKWYARKKPKKSKWSLRVVHVDKPALLRDLFVRGKIDVYGEYHNTGVPVPAVTTSVSKSKVAVEESGIKRPLVEAKYIIKERSWKTLWNFSPTAFFTDRSGLYWRQRRVFPNSAFTDGQKVYESSYHYSEGRNGVKLVSNNLEKYLDQYGEDTKERFLQKLDGKAKPDFVLEY